MLYICVHCSAKKNLTFTQKQHVFKRKHDFRKVELDFRVLAPTSIYCTVMVGSLHWRNSLALYKMELSEIVLEFSTVQYMPGSLHWRNKSSLLLFSTELCWMEYTSEPEQTWLKPTVHLVYTMGEGSVP